MSPFQNLLIISSTSICTSYQNISRRLFSSSYPNYLLYRAFLYSSSLIFYPCIKSKVVVSIPHFATLPFSSHFQFILINHPRFSKFINIAIHKILQPYPSHNLHPQHFTSSTLNTCLQVFLHVRHLVQQTATPDVFSINIKSGEGVFLSSFSFIFYLYYLSCNSVSLILRLHRRIMIFHILIKCICSIDRFILRYHGHYHRLLGTFDLAF